MNRREAVAGLVAGSVAALVGGPSVAAEAPARLFAGTALADNPVARQFARVDMLLPAVPVLTARGQEMLSGVGGKTWLLALWAEWCAPCLAEIRDLAALRPQVANDRFDIGLLLTASAARLDRAGAIVRLRPLGATGLPLLVEPDGGNQAAIALAAPPAGLVATLGAKAPRFSLPCALLIDAHGRVRGRASGMVSAPVTGGPTPTLTTDQKAALARGERVVLKALTDADKKDIAENGRTAWHTPPALAMLKTLGGGLPGWN